MNSFCKPIADELQRLKDVEKLPVQETTIELVRQGDWQAANSTFHCGLQSRECDWQVLLALLKAAYKESWDDFFKKQHERIIDHADKVVKIEWDASKIEWEPSFDLFNKIKNGQ